jgi:hypothetical protein
LQLTRTPDNDSRAAVSRTGRRVFVTALLLLFAAHAAAAPDASAQTDASRTNGRALITTASGARLRERPDTDAAEVGRLQLGLVVEEVERTAERSRVGSAENYWSLVSAPGGARGWVFGSLVAPFDPARRDATYVKLAAERVENAAATFPELSELVRFLERATKEVTSREPLAELELTRLVALGRTLANIPFEGQEKPPYKPWVTEHDAEVVYSEPAGQWYVRAELLWDLEKKYRGLPVAERAAWEAAQTPLPGECEGYLPCHIYRESETSGRYLLLYPRGAHADAALANLSESLGHVVEDLRGGASVFEVPREDRANFRKSLAALRAQLAQVPAAKKSGVLTQLDTIARRFP